MILVAIAIDSLLNEVVKALGKVNPEIAIVCEREEIPQLELTPYEDYVLGYDINTCCDDAINKAVRLPEVLRGPRLDVERGLLPFSTNEYDIKPDRVAA